MLLQALDKQLPKLEEGSSASAFSMENILAEVEDLLSYCNDILCTGRPLLTSSSVRLRLIFFHSSHARSKRYGGRIVLWLAGETFLTQLLLQRLCEAFVKPVLLQPLRQREEASEKTGEQNAGLATSRLAGEPQEACGRLRHVPFY